MLTELEAVDRRQATEGCIQRRLDGIWHLHVSHGAAHLTDQVMMMTTDVFCQLESGPLVVGHHARNHPSVFEDRKVAVHRTLRQERVTTHDVGDRDRVIGVLERIDELAAQCRVPLADAHQSCRSNLVHV